MLKLAITGANGHVGQAVLRRLTASRFHTIALVRKPQALSAHEVIDDWMNNPRAVDALAHAHHVIHLAGALFPEDTYAHSNVLPAQRVAQAITQGQSRRVVFLSFTGADAGSSNAYLASKARAEKVLQQAAQVSTVVRSTYIVGTPQWPGPWVRQLLARRRPVWVLGSGRQKIAPVLIDSVVDVLVAAAMGDQAGTFDLAGPDVMSFDELTRLINRDAKVRIRHLPGPAARLLACLRPGRLPPAAVDLLLKDHVADPQPTLETFSLAPRSVIEAWQISKMPSVPPKPMH